MRTFLVTFSGIDSPNRRAGVEGAGVELGWSTELGIHPELPEARHLRFRIEALDADDLLRAIDQAGLPEGVEIAEAREERPPTFGWPSDR